MKMNMTEMHFLTPEEEHYMLTSFFKFDTTVAPVDCERGSLRLLAAEVGKHFPKIVVELGEPRALAVYSSMSGILAKVPPWDTFGDEAGIKIHVAALFYIGWELAGSAERDGPSIISTVEKACRMRAVYRFLKSMYK